MNPNRRDIPINQDFLAEFRDAGPRRVAVGQRVNRNLPLGPVGLPRFIGPAQVAPPRRPVRMISLPGEEAEDG